jgi:hypothetical protein
VACSHKFASGPLRQILAEEETQFFHGLDLAVSPRRKVQEKAQAVNQPCVNDHNTPDERHGITTRIRVVGRPHGSVGNLVSCPNDSYCTQLPFTVKADNTLNRTGIPKDRRTVLRSIGD